MSDSMTVRLAPASVEALRRIGKSLGTASIEETLSRVIGSQAAIAEQVQSGHSVVIKDPSGKLWITRSQIVPNSA